MVNQLLTLCLQLATLHAKGYQSSWTRMTMSHGSSLHPWWPTLKGSSILSQQRLITALFRFVRLKVTAGVRNRFFGNVLKIIKAQVGRLSLWNIVRCMESVIALMITSYAFTCNRQARCFHV